MAKKDEMKSISIANGKFNFLINKTFSKSKINKNLISDIQQTISTIKNENIKFDEESDINKTIVMCILKNFTNLGLHNLDLSLESDVRKLIAVQTEFYDQEIFEEIISNIDPIELKKTQKAISKLNNNESDINGDN